MVCIFLNEQDSETSHWTRLHQWMRYLNEFLQVIHVVNYLLPITLNYRCAMIGNLLSVCNDRENKKKVIQFFPTALCNVTVWRHSRPRAHWLMPLVREGGLREKYVFCVPRELQRLLSLFCLWEESVGGA